ncbi:MAG: peptidase S41, partial [Muribaculaceae bacterium]|nr:peptidase S41 [Muribaculaceae bacterium]
MKRFFIVGVALVSLVAGASEAPLWLRNTAVSPDGATIAFTYGGDIYTVPVNGGAARQITSNPAYDTAPVWSPDGTRIAFASTRAGSTDIFVTQATGGTPERITTHSGSETPLTWLNDSTILFSASLAPSYHALNDAFFGQTYTVVAKQGARPRKFLSLNMRSASARDGRVLFEEKNTYENEWRKHETSAATPDIYLYSDGDFAKLTHFVGSDRNPVWLGA